MFSNYQRINREKKTVKVMIEMYCHLNHGTNTLCLDCKNILDYAFLRLDKCMYGMEKPTCINCPTHCYQKTKREQIREIMRFSGPKMIFNHPYLALMHILDNKILPKKVTNLKEF
jgi:hypothetical protein